MKKAAALLGILVSLALWSAMSVAPSPAAAEQKDDPKCKEHPLFTRMPSYWIRGCQEIEFDARAMPVAKGKTEQVEGRVWTYQYYPQADGKGKASPLQILRNFENAVKAKGGSTVWATKDRETLKLTVDGREVWVDLAAEFTGKYFLTIVERKAMSQDIVADAAAFANDLKTTGHVAIYGIYFDTGKTELKPESQAAIGEIAKLLKAEAGLKLHVVGHTDNVGGLESNMKLSQGRAEAVVAALTGQHGVPAARLKSGGVGPLAPVASNDAEEGRAKNRRVELVKQ